MTPIARAAADLRGYFEARDGGLFTQCGETTRRRVIAIDNGTRAALADSVAPRFLAARGALLGRDEVQIGALELSGGDAWNCESRFDQFVYAARGIDVPWSLEVTTAAVSFSESPGAPPMVFPYRTFSVSGSAWTFAFDAEGTDAAESMHIELAGRVCVDGMTDSVYALTATIETMGRTFAGCAWRGEREP